MDNIYFGSQNETWSDTPREFVEGLQSNMAKMSKEELKAFMSLPQTVKVLEKKKIEDFKQKLLK